MIVKARINPLGMEMLRRSAILAPAHFRQKSQYQKIQYQYQKIQYQYQKIQ